MSHAVSDAVIDQVWAGPHSLRFRLGVEFRRTDQAPPSELLPARYMRIQVASPPPDRIDGGRWQDGLRVSDGTDNGREFDPRDPMWKQSGVFPLEGISPLNQPAPNTLVYDRSVAIPARTTTFILTDPRSVEPTNHFISVDYPVPLVDGDEQTVVVAYSCEVVLRFAREVKEWIAVSTARFIPSERRSADYIIAVEAAP